MSDSVLTIATAFSDVAELAQGFMERVDGQHLLLPLSVEAPVGAAVQFVVMLGDGTAAFMGAGTCERVTDQGAASADAHRFETLLGQLQFDERSQPVYDYIVAIRSQAYAIQQAQEPGADDAAAADADDEPTEFVNTQAVLAAQDDDADVEMGYEDASEDDTAGMDDVAQDDAAGYADVDYAAQAVSAYPGADPSQQQPVPGSQFHTAPPVAVPTGTLQRPAIGVHWQPASPRRPQPRPSSGLFHYNGSGLPVPEGPPFPDLPSQQWVQPAPAPAAAAAAVSRPPESYADAPSGAPEAQGADLSGDEGPDGSDYAAGAEDSADASHGADAAGYEAASDGDGFELESDGYDDAGEDGAADERADGSDEMRSAAPSDDSLDAGDDALDAGDDALEDDSLDDDAADDDADSVDVDADSVDVDADSVDVDADSVDVDADDDSDDDDSDDDDSDDDDDR